MLLSQNKPKHLAFSAKNDFCGIAEE